MGVRGRIYGKVCHLPVSECGLTPPCLHPFTLPGERLVDLLRDECGAEAGEGAEASAGTAHNLEGEERGRVMGHGGRPRLEGCRRVR
jgi:hypothetical protein